MWVGGYERRRATRAHGARTSARSCSVGAFGEGAAPSPSASGSAGRGRGERCFGPVDHEDNEAAQDRVNVLAQFLKVLRRELLSLSKVYV